MKRRWIAVLGAVLVGFCFTTGCDQGQTTSKPDDIPKKLTPSQGQGSSDSVPGKGAANQKKS